MLWLTRTAANIWFMSGYFVSGTFETSLVKFEEAAAWMTSLGIDVPRCRVGKYIRDLKLLVKAVREGNFSEIASHQMAIDTALYEAEEFVQIHRGLSSGVVDGALRSKLKIAAGGPASYVDEKLGASSNRARDTAFELLTAERLASGGLLPLFEPSDIAVDAEPRRLLFECKRIQSANDSAIERNFRDAERQLQEGYRRTFGFDSRGVIALDVTKLINPKFVNPALTQEEISTLLSKTLEDFVMSRHRLWSSANKKTIGVYARISLMVRCTEPKMITYGQQHTLYKILHESRLKSNPFDRQSLLRLNDAFQKAMAKDSAPRTVVK
jgi:hypothetical protein